MVPVPHELHDYILDFLHGDSKALKACSLTCRSWYPTARYHLYNKVHLPSPAACEAFGEIMQAKGPSYIGQFIRFLSLSKVVPHGTDKHSTGNSLAQLWPSLFSALPHVAHLELSFLEMDNSFHANLVQNFSHTIDITLQYCRFASFGDFATVLLSFPSLRRCTLRGISWESGQGAFTSTAAERRGGPISIKGLTLGRDLDLQVLVEWLLQEHLCDDLESIAACCAREADAAVLGELLRASAPTLTHVDLDWYCSSYRGEHYPAFFVIRRTTC